MERVVDKKEMKNTIRISDIKLNISHTEEHLKEKLIKTLKISNEEIIQYKIVKKSIDARKKQLIQYIYTVDVVVKQPKNIKINPPKVTIPKEEKYTFHNQGNLIMKERPVIVGSGPAGLFCALYLAEIGLKPIIIERGDQVKDRVLSVEKFWETQILDINSNVQFGEGGAGTFSDGKLNTLVKDTFGRNKKVLEIFVQFGAPEDILYVQKPHIGTDLLRNIITNMRNKIIELGGEFRFRTLLSDIIIEGEKIVAIRTISTKDGCGSQELIPCEQLVLALGHSARDTFYMLYEKGLDMEAKAFAIGVRVEHPQDLIGENQYGKYYKDLPTAEYKLTHKASNERGVYSFCMCPGGFVVNASSEENCITVNGMSNRSRSEKNANSAIIVTVTPTDFENNHPLSGVEFQRKWEGMAYKCGEGVVPVQLYKDFKQSVKSENIENITPNICGKYNLANLRDCLPSYVSNAIIEGIDSFGKKIKGFDRPDTILSGIEARTSSPVRILRDENLESNIRGIYPCGEGAGYSGGITSASIDGIKVAEKISSKYKAN